MVTALNTTNGVEPERSQGRVSLLRQQGQADLRRGEARPDRGARDPARVEGRLDLAERDGEAPGHGLRRRRPQAVPLQRGLSGPAGAGEVRQPDPLRGRFADATRGNGPPLRPGGIRSRTRLGDRLAVDRAGLVPGRLGAIRPRRNLRRDDAAAAPRQGARPARLPVVSGEARDPGPHRGRGSGSRRGDAELARAQGARASSSTSGRATPTTSRARG